MNIVDKRETVTPIEFYHLTSGSLFIKDDTPNVVYLKLYFPAKDSAGVQFNAIKLSNGVAVLIDAAHKVYPVECELHILENK